jgi:hypothetical protein
MLNFATMNIIMIYNNFIIIEDKRNKIEFYEQMYLNVFNNYS